jgi:cold shock CspA family protein
MRRSSEEEPMPQGTIRDFDPDSRDGSLLMDDRTEVVIDATSVEGSGILSLRIGQRVRFDLIEEGGRKLARTLRIVTF